MMPTGTSSPVCGALTGASFGLRTTGRVGPYIEDIAINANGDIFACSVMFGANIVRSTNNGVNWGIIGQNGLTLLIDASGHIYAGSLGGNVFLSVDNGESWQDVSIGEDIAVWDLVINTDGYIFAGTSSGVFRRLQAATSVEQVGSDIPREFILEQNYPNPFNPTTAITFDLAKESTVTLNVYNTLGQRIRTLVAGRYRPGAYQVMWDGRDDAGCAVAGGVYVYRLKADAYTQARTMVLMK